MQEGKARQVTEMLSRAAQGDAAASEALLPLLYDELRAMARGHFRRQTPGHTLQPTALVHEVYLKLRCREGWESRGHFLAVASRAMRQVLANHAESRRAAKRGGDWMRVTLSGLGAGETSEFEAGLLDLHDALTELAGLSPRQARILEMRFLAGGSEEEVARALGVSVRTVRREWRMARAFLHRALGGGV